MNGNIFKHAFVNASLTALYIVCISLFMFYVPERFAEQPDTVFAPIIMLSLFVFSAAVTGSLVLGKPLLWYLDNKKKEAVMLLMQTLGIFFTILLAIVFIFTSTTSTENRNQSSWIATSTPEAAWKYPANFGTEYISPTDWPPQLRVLDEAYSCEEDGEESSRAGKTEEIRVRGQVFCKTTLTGAAAGSMYMQYAYAYARDNHTEIITFSVRFPQCANYDDRRAELCRADHSAFDPDDLVSGIVKTVDVR